MFGVVRPRASLRLSRLRWPNGPPSSISSISDGGAAVEAAVFGGCFTLVLRRLLLLLFLLDVATTCDPLACDAYYYVDANSYGNDSCFQYKLYDDSYVFWLVHLIG